jgi:hypothetical protein
MYRACTVLILRTAGPAPPIENKKQNLSINHLEMHLRHRGYNSQWMVVVFFMPPFTSKNYEVHCVSKLDGVILIQHRFPMAVNAIWLPHSMDAVVGLIRQGKFATRPFLHHLFLRTIGELAESEGCVALSDKFASEMEANDYFIDKVIDTYLVTAIHVLKRSQREKMRAKVSHAKEKWIMKRNERQQAELYLGRLTFHKELKRSCSEFYSSLRSIWGFCPLKLDFLIC